MKRYLLTLLLCLTVFAGSFAIRPVQADAPDDPESAARSTGIYVSEFFEAFKETVKAGGKHSVSIEDRARKNGSRISVDDAIEIMVFFTENNKFDVIDRFNFQLTYESNREREDGKPIFYAFLKTLGGFFGFSVTEEQSEGMWNDAVDGRSFVFQDLLLYGSTKEKSGKNVLTIKVYYTGSGYDRPEQTSYSQSAEDEFRALVEDLKADGTIPYGNGTYGFHEDYQNEWAQLNWYQWESFENARNFVISTDITWNSASFTPDYPRAGCGFVFRAKDTSNNLYASLRMDGKVYFGGIRNGQWLNYNNFAYGTHSVKGSAQLIVVVNGDTVTAYVDGSFVGRQRGIIIDDTGKLAFSVWSGTNKDWGTRCIFQNVYYYIW